MISASVTNVDFFRIWRASEDMDLDFLIRRLRGDEPQTPAMLAGIAFHTALENMSLADSDQAFIEANGYEFHFTCDCEIALPSIKEMRIDKQYGGLRVRGRVDGLYATEVVDYKTTGQFDAEKLMAGYQWRLYLDMLQCDKFTWKVFVISDDDPTHYRVTGYHELSQYRYPGLERDCAKLASEYLEFVSQPDIVRQLTREQAAPVAKPATIEAQEPISDAFPMPPRANIPPMPIVSLEGDALNNSSLETQLELSIEQAEAAKPKRTRRKRS